eukprot:4623325-Lingulodinium_polyedra.AAC.1
MSAVEVPHFGHVRFIKDASGESWLYHDVTEERTMVQPGMQLGFKNNIGYVFHTSGMSQWINSML